MQKIPEKGMPKTMLKSEAESNEQKSDPGWAPFDPRVDPLAYGGWGLARIGTQNFAVCLYSWLIFRGYYSLTVSSVARATHRGPRS